MRRGCIYAGAIQICYAQVEKGGKRKAGAKAKAIAILLATIAKENGDKREAEAETLDGNSTKVKGGNAGVGGEPEIQRKKVIKERTKPI